jgi:hypothetical protein
MCAFVAVQKEATRVHTRAHLSTDGFVSKAERAADGNKSAVPWVAVAVALRDCYYSMMWWGEYGAAAETFAPLFLRGEREERGTERKSKWKATPPSS